MSIGHKMLLEFGNNFSAARESIAWVWRERDNHVAGRCPVAVVVMDVVDLQRSAPLALYWQIRQVFMLLTMVPAVLIVLFERTALRAPVRTCISAMPMLRRWDGLDGGKETNERHFPGDPQSHMLDAYIWVLCCRAETRQRTFKREMEMEGTYHFSACAPIRLELRHKLLTPLAAPCFIVGWWVMRFEC